jgi:CMP-N,N'-diacetyllegionaminic acid synthase
MKNIICLICAREGSKGIKNKNIISFHKKPLIEWTFKIAKKIKKFKKIYVSTDSKKIIKIAKKNKIEVPFKRPDNLARTNSKEIDVWRHTLRYLKK